MKGNKKKEKSSFHRIVLLNSKQLLFNLYLIFYRNFLSLCHKFQYIPIIKLFKERKISIVYIGHKLRFQ